METRRGSPLATVTRFRRGTAHRPPSAIAVGAAVLLFVASHAYAQVGPAEIVNPRLKASEQAYLTQLVELNRTITQTTFPFALKLSRYAGLDPKEQLGADARGLEFVNFHDRLVLKITGNYNAAYNADLLTPNERANRVFGDVILPILRLLPNYFSPSASFDAFGFEIAYHTRRRTQGYGFEGKEIVVLVMDKADALSYVAENDDSKKQGILNRSEIFFDGKPFGFALGARDPFDAEALERSVRNRPQAVATTASATSSDPHPEQTAAFKPAVLGKPAVQLPHPQAQASSAGSPAPVAQAPAPAGADVDALQRKFQPQLDSLAAEGAAKYHFVDYSPPSFVLFRNQPALQLTLRNPATFEKESTSIYKRAAQSFDLFLATELKPILDKVPESSDFGSLDVTILNDLVSKSGKSSEALEFVFPLKALRQFVDADITNQELVNQSVVLVNGVRIALNLQLVE